MKNIGKIGVMLLLGIVIVLTSVSCGSGISQDEYDSVLAELAEAQDEIAGLTSELAAARAVETEGVESSLKYQNLLKDYNDLVDESELAEAEYAALSADYEALKAEHQMLQSQNESNLNQINLLQTENTQLRAHVDNLTPPFPEIAPIDLEEAILVAINTARAEATLNTLSIGSNLLEWSRTNSLAMSISKTKVFYNTSQVAGQQHFIAGGYPTVDTIVDAAMMIWQSNVQSFQDNVLDEDVTYAGVGVVKAGDIYYITFLANNFP